MKRIDTASKAANLFGAGKDGFKDGNLGAGIAPTDLNAAWFNGVQEELLAVIETAGLAPDGAVLTQLRQAIDVMVRKRAGAACAAAGTADALTGTFLPAVTALTDGALVLVRAAAANATTTPTFKADATAVKTIVKAINLPLAAGDISGAGHWLMLQYDITLDRWVLLNPAAATAANDAAGADNSTRLATTGWAKAGFSVSLGVNGHIKLPAWLGGWFAQWGTAATSATPGAVTNVPFNLAFPTAVYVVIASNASTSTSGTALFAGTPTVTQFSASASTATLAFYWFALGK